jgi:hypothetical protein
LQTRQVDFLIVPESWSAVLKQAKEAGVVDLIPYSVELDYYYFQYRTHSAQ